MATDWILGIVSRFFWYALLSGQHSKETSGMEYGWVVGWGGMDGLGSDKSNHEDTV